MANWKLNPADRVVIDSPVERREKRATDAYLAFRRDEEKRIAWLNSPEGKAHTAALREAEKKAEEDRRAWLERSAVIFANRISSGTIVRGMIPLTVSYKSGVVSFIARLTFSPNDYPQESSWSLGIGRSGLLMFLTHKSAEEARKRIGSGFTLYVNVNVKAVRIVGYSANGKSGHLEVVEW